MAMDQRTRLRLASTWAIQSSREIVNTLFHDCGSMSVFEENPFERRLRDIDTVAQQGQGRILHYETVGQVMLGVAPENVSLSTTFLGGGFGRRIDYDYLLQAAQISKAVNKRFAMYL